MPNTLENYLREVESHLASLPEVVRQSEIREIDGHLQQIAADFQAQGLNEDDASTRATQRFGSSRSLGLHLRDAWERNCEPLPVALAVVLGNWFFYGVNFLLFARTMIGTMVTNGALGEALSPVFAIWVLASVFLLPFALNFAFGYWGGRRVALAVVPAYFPVLWFAFQGSFFRVSSPNFHASSFTMALFTVGAALLGAWIGATWQRKRRFALIGAVASTDEAAAMLAKSRRVKVFSWPLAAWLLGLGAVGGGILGFVWTRTEAVLHPKTPEAAVRVMLNDASMNMGDMKPATKVSTRLLPPVGAAEKAGRERRVYYKATMRASDNYRARRVAYLQHQLLVASKNHGAAHPPRYLRAALARLKPEGYVLQRVVRVQNTPDGWNVAENRDGNVAPWAWLYDIYYESAPQNP